MTNLVNLSALAAATSVSGTDIVNVTQGSTGPNTGIGRKATVRQVAEAGSGAGSVMLYGAKGDGVTDDTAAFVSAAAATGQIIVPAGTFIVSALAFTTLATVRGAGRYKTTLRRAPGGPGVMFVQVTGVQGFEMSDLTIDGNRANCASGCHNFYASGCGGTVLRNVRSINAKAVSGLGNGFLFSNTTDQANRTVTTIDNCEATGNDADGLRLNIGGGFSVDGGSYSVNGGSGIICRDDTIPEPLDTMLGLSFTGVSAKYNVGAGIAVGVYLTGLNTNINQMPTDAVTMSGCIAIGNGSYGLSGQSIGITMVGCVAKVNGGVTANTGGILFNSSKSSCIGCIVTGNTGYGIDAGGGGVLTISACTVADTVAGGTALNIGGDIQTNVVGNTFSNNPYAIIIAGIDFGGSVFPLTSYIRVSVNFIDTGATGTGIYMPSNPLNVTLENNTFYGTNPGDYINGLYDGPVAIRGNNRAGQVGVLQVARGGARITVPDYVDIVEATGGGSFDTIISTSQSVGEGRVFYYTVTNPGSGYSTTPGAVTATVTGGGGTGATATVAVRRDGVVGAVQVATSGTGYTSNPSVVISGGGGTGATATAQFGFPSQCIGRRLDVILGAGITMATGTGNIILPEGNIAGVSGGRLISLYCLPSGIWTTAGYGTAFPTDVSVSNTHGYGWLDTGGSSVRVFLQNDNNQLFQGTNSSGASRTIWSLAQRSSTSSLNYAIPIQLSDNIALSRLFGQTATGTNQVSALSIGVAQHVECTTVAAGTGISLASSLNSIEVVVFNAGANTLNVYPPGGAAIDALAANAPVTVAAGSRGRYVRINTNQWRTA